jgi:hypothetical protein
MVLCSRFQRIDLETSPKGHFDFFRKGNSCLACIEGIELAKEIQEPQKRRNNIQTKVRANHILSFAD